MQPTNENPADDLRSRYEQWLAEATLSAQRLNITISFARSDYHDFFGSPMATIRSADDNTLQDYERSWSTFWAESAEIELKRT